MDVLERIGEAGIIPVVVLERVEDAVPTAQALLRGGIDVMEITFRTAAARDAIAQVHQACPEMEVGAGTIRNVEQCIQAVEAGASFIVSPGYCSKVVAWCTQHRIAIVPGCVTPTEIMAALDHDIRVLKFFPAVSYGGLSAMKALSGPFPDIKFIPTGGISAANLSDYISSPLVYAVGGSWMCAKTDLASGHFDKILSSSAQAREIVLKNRNA